jgi:hypothetical protein
LIFIIKDVKCRDLINHDLCGAGIASNAYPAKPANSHVQNYSDHKPIAEKSK